MLLQLSSAVGSGGDGNDGQATFACGRDVSWCIANHANGSAVAKSSLRLGNAVSKDLTARLPQVAEGSESEVVAQACCSQLCPPNLFEVSRDNSHQLSVPLQRV